MKEMIYKNQKDREILEQGNYLGYNFWIISYGSHPCAYVELQKEHPYYGRCDCDTCDLDIDVHGGITFRNYGLGNTISRDKYLLGWDYNHYNDYNYIDGQNGWTSGKKWTTEEIFDDVKSVIKQLKEVEVNHG